MLTNVGCTLFVNVSVVVFNTVFVFLIVEQDVNNNNINNPIATPKQTTTYTVFGYDINGCLDSADIVIHVDTTMNQDVPSAFTPNGDGNNDVFKPVGIKFQYMVEFRVYNRWGQELFYTNNEDTHTVARYRYDIVGLRRVCNTQRIAEVNTFLA